MFKKILFATSATDACVHAARVSFNIAGLYEAHMIILHVLESPSVDGGPEAADVKAKETIENDDADLSKCRAEIHSRYVENLSKTKSYEVKIIAGQPHMEILREIRENQPDLVVMGGNTAPEDSPANQIERIGSTLQKVAAACACPLLIINRKAASFWGAISNVVFATDFSKASDVAFDFACRLARNTGCELHIFHAQNIRLSPGSSVYSQNEIEQRIREKLRFYRKKYLPKMKGIDHYAIEVWEGTPYIEIVKYARDKFADLVVMAHDSKSPGTESEEFGSNTKRVILRGGCPVLCINKYCSV